MRDAVICEPLRTAVGGFGGMFRDVTVTELAATVIRELVARTSLPTSEIDDVILGQGYPNGEASALGRIAALDAGLPIEVPGMQVDRRCGAGLQALMLGCMEIQTGAADLVLAGGAESMSQAEFYATGMRWGVKGGGVMLEDRLVRGRITAGGVNHPMPGGMIETAENLRRQYAIPRAEQDELALRSHQLAVAAQEDGTFAQEIVPVLVKSRKEEKLIDRDEHPRADTSLERLGELRAIMGRTDPDATVTAGNASGQNDGAAVCVITHPEKAAELGLKPFARLVSWAAAGVAPETMGIGPVPASKRALERGAGPGGHGPDRAQRGIRRTGARGAARVGAARRPGARQRARIGDLTRAPDRRDRRADHDHLAARARAPRRALRPRDDVHRRRAGDGGGVREHRLRRGVARRVGRASLFPETDSLQLP
jgi:acetyl-CoA acetyltransferase family protein